MQLPHKKKKEDNEGQSEKPKPAEQIMDITRVNDNLVK